MMTADQPQTAQPHELHTRHSSRSVCVENADTIASFTHYGMEATVTLLALCRLLGKIRPEERQEGTETAEDLVNVCAGMEAHLRTIHDAFENIQVLAEVSPSEDGSEALEEAELTDHQEPIAVS
jgi:hypothetical protein